MAQARSSVGGASSGALSRRLVVVLAVAVGVSVASNYYAQPLLATIRHSFGAGAGEAGLVVTASQVGYALGLVLLLPLGDLIERRRLVVVMSGVTALALIGAAFSPSLGFLFAAAALVGATSVVAQVLVAFTASLSSDDERGRMVGAVMSGLLLGILLARTAAGYIAQASSWRVVYLVAGALMVVVAVVLAKSLPEHREQSGLTYPQILGSVLRIFREEPVLRRRSLYGAFSFGAFAVLWTSLAFLLAAPPYHYGSGTIGLFGLVGAAGAGMASIAGRLADRGLQVVVTMSTAAAMLAAFFILWADPRSLVPLLAGIVILDLGCQGLHISNQSEIYKLVPSARSRVNAAYMTGYFVGGTLGSVGSAFCYQSFGWGGVCGLGAGFAGLAVLLSLSEPRFTARRAAIAAAGS